MSSRSNVSGAFERARQKWHFAVIYISRGMGRGATGALQTAGLLVEYTSRALFHRNGDLVAFPGLDLLAMLAGVNEKTIRRAMGKLEQAGLVRTQQRYNDSNLYYLTIPPDAEAHLFACEMARTKHRRGKWYGLRNPPDNAVTKCPSERTDGSGGDTKCPTTSELHSDLHSISKSADLASALISEDQKEKRLSDEERGIYSLARDHFGDRGASLAAKALRAGISLPEIKDLIAESVEFGGGGELEYFAHALSPAWRDDY